MRIYFYILSTLVLFSNVCFAEIQAKASLEAESASIGDSVLLTIRSEFSEDYRFVEVSQIPQKEYLFVGSPSRPNVKVENGLRQLMLTYPVSFFDLNTLHVPPFELEFREINTGQKRAVQTNPVFIQINSIKTGDETEEIKDIRDISNPWKKIKQIIFRSFFWLFAILLLLFLFVFRKKIITFFHREQKALTPYEYSLSLCRSVESLVHEEPKSQKEIAEKLTLSVRSYLHYLSKENLEDKTTHELQEILPDSAFSGFSKELAELLKEFDLVKFANEKLSSDRWGELILSAKDMISQFKQIEDARKANEDS